MPGGIDQNAAAFRLPDAVGSRPPVRRGALLQLGLFAVVAFVIVGVVALVPQWLPTQASAQAHRIAGVEVLCASAVPRKSCR